MNKGPLVRLVSYLGLCWSFDWLFFQQEGGANLALFGLITLVALWSRNRQQFGLARVQFMAVAVIYASFLALWHGHFLSQLSLVLVSLSLGGLVHEPTSRFLGSGLLRIFFSLKGWLLQLRSVVALPIKWMLGASRAKQFRYRLGHSFRVSIFPLSVSCCFLALYSFASTDYFSFWRNGLLDLSNWLGQLTALITLAHFAFLLWGSWVVYVLIFNEAPIALNKWEKGRGDVLIRKRRPAVELSDPLVLKRNYRSAVILLCMVNAVLLVFICFDFYFLWSQLGRVTDHREIREMVHQSTYVLLASISLAMFVLLWIFWRNLNFFPKNQLLLRLAYCWLVLNGFLLISVVARNSYHIWYNGLGYLRIGVCAFLILTLAGLIGLFRKIRYRRTLFYLLRTNAWVWMVVLLLFSSVEWNRVIVRYNLFHHSGNVRYTSFTLQFPDHTVDLMLEAEATDRSFGQKHDKESLKHDFEDRARAFLEGEKGMPLRDWRGWTYADYRTRKKLKKLQL